jgi:hypothetical protein
MVTNNTADIDVMMAVQRSNFLERECDAMMEKIMGRNNYLFGAMGMNAASGAIRHRRFQIL